MQPARMEVGKALATRPGSLDWIPSGQVSGGSKWGLPEKFPLGAEVGHEASGGRVMRKLLAGTHRQRGGPDLIALLLPSTFSL